MQHNPRVRAAWGLLGLGVDPDLAEITRAYRRQARDTHPDVSATPDAAARFEALSDAYQVAVEATRQGEIAPPRTASRPQPAPRRPVTELTPDDRWFNTLRHGSAPLVAGPVRVQPSPAPRNPDGNAAPHRGAR
jgi:hypothetical protein